MTTAAWQPGTLYPPGSLVRRNSAPPATAQAITNPGFDIGSLDGWTTEGSAWLISTTKYGGTHSANYQAASPISGTAVGRIYSTAIAPCRPGQTINASCMVKQGAADAGNAGGRVQLIWLDDADAVITVADGSNVNNSDTANWRKSSITATAPAGTAGVRIGARCFQQEEGKKVHVDNFAWDHVYAIQDGGLVFRAVQAADGYSGATEPTWPSVLGVQVVDNTVTWEAVDSAYVTWEATPILKSGATEPDWPEQMAAGVIDNTINWIATNRRVEDEKCPNTKIVAIAASKIFCGDTDIVGFSATTNPLDWSTTQDAGYLPFGLQTYGSNPVLALGLYRGNLVAFNASGFQMWQVDQDPANMALLDAAPVGCTEPRSLQPVQNDLVLLSAVGVRNIAIAGASTNLQAGSTGEPIDPLVLAKVRAAAYTPISCTFPAYGQYWLIFGDEAMVYTSAGVNKGSWSRYTFPAEITDVTMLGSDLYLRMASGAVLKITEEETSDDVYCQGEAPVLTGDDYGQTVELAWTYDYPEFDAVTFRILRATNGGLLHEIAYVAGDVFTYVDDTVQLGNLYVYAVVARPDPDEAIDSPESNTVSFEFPAVAPAPVLSGVVVGSNSELEWTAAGSLTGSVITQYQVWRSADGADYVLIGSTDDLVLEYTDPIELDIVYRYYVVAVSDEETVSPNSNVVTLSDSAAASYFPAYWINPGAEYGTLGGWTVTESNFTSLAHGSAPVGTRIFRGVASASSRMYQDFDVADTGVPEADIDAGLIELVVDWWAGVYLQQANPAVANDAPELNVTFYDTAGSGGAVLGTESTGEIVVTGSGNVYSWTNRLDSWAVPVGTRRISIELHAVRHYAANNDAAFDEVQPYLREI